MGRADNIQLLQDLQYSRRVLARKAGFMVAAIALTGCIGASGAYADDAAVIEAEPSAQAVAEQSVSSQQARVTSDDSDNLASAVSQGAADENQTIVTSGSNATATSNDAGASASTDPTQAPEYTSGQLAAKSSENIKDANGNTIAAFDLRHATADTDGTLTSDWSYQQGATQSTITGGTTYVTPVKLQNPWGSCWAFSTTAASETSLLTELDQADDGKMNGSIDYTKAAAWASADLADDGEMNGSATDVYEAAGISTRYAVLAEYASDLSERYTTWFAFYDVSVDSPYPEQAGEGRYFIDDSDADKDASSVYDAGGMPWLALSEYASGLGPVPEWMAPYISDEGLYRAPTPVLKDGELVYRDFTSLEAALAYYEETWTQDVIDEFNKKNGTHATKASLRLATGRSKSGTWSLPDSDAYQVLAELSNSNVLDQDLTHKGLTAVEIALMKQELLEGHPISIGYAADQSKPGQQLSGNTYINTETWAQYTFIGQQITHAVTIVGYDDNYAASNFTHDIYKLDDSGKLVKDEEATKLTTPAGNGAWICKNSWGSVNSAGADYNKWGIDGSGYFYLSYYDKSISNMESYEYDVSADAVMRSSYVSYQHDLATSNGYNLVNTGDTVSRVCNVFDGPEQGEGSVSIRDLGFVTGHAGDSVVLEVYVMNDDVENVGEWIDSHDPTETLSQEGIVNAGFHRITLGSAIKILPGQKFAVVQTTTKSDGTYEYALSASYSKDFAVAYNDAMEPLGAEISYYLETVVNEGESLLYTADGWTDWTVASQAQNQKDTDAMVARLRNLAKAYEDKADFAVDPELKAIYRHVAESLADFNLEDNFGFAYDNFCIKAYADETGIDVSKTLIGAMTRSFVFDGTAHGPEVLVSMGGTVLREGIDYVLYGDLQATEAGVYQILVQGIGEYMGSAVYTWEIVSAAAPSDQGGTSVVPVSYAYGANESSLVSPATGDAATTAVGFAGALGAIASAALLRLRRRRD